jgi:hypothetical protein
VSWCELLDPGGAFFGRQLERRIDEPGELRQFSGVALHE